MSRTPGRWRRWGVILLVQLMVAIALSELALRLATRVNAENGMAMIGRFVLLPYRPSPAAVRAWQARPPGNYLLPDATLGWSLRPGGRSPDGLYRANDQGARVGDQGSYAAVPPSGRRRVVTVGDSFTHGDGVGYEETWQRELERLRSDLEVVNLGVPGYGTDQSYLRFVANGAALRPELALLGIWPENVCRNLNVVRFFLQPAGGFGFLSKPRFVVVPGGLENVNAPTLAGEPLLQALVAPATSAPLRHDHWALAEDLEWRTWYHLRTARVAATVANLYQRRRLRERLYSGADPAGIDVTVAIADAFARDARSTGAVPVIVLLPMLDLLERYPDEDSLPLVRALRARGLNAVDLGPPMARAVKEEPGCCYQPDRHFSPQGNRRLAAWLLERLTPWLDATGRQRSDGDPGAPLAASRR